jgi:hypothetical protein
MEELTIKFSKKLCEPFTASNGREMMRIRIPNVDPADKTPWAQFVLRASQVHDNKYGKGFWAKLPVDGETLVSKPYVAGEKDGKRVWENDTRSVPNTELKTMVEAYKTRGRENQDHHEPKEDRESAVGRLGAAKKEAGSRVPSRPTRTKPAQMEK